MTGSGTSLTSRTTRKLFTTILAAALLAPCAAYAAEEDAHANFVKRVQMRLHELGFDPGPINGENSNRPRPRSRR